MTGEHPNGRVRLVGVIVQPRFVLDRDGELSELPHDAVNVTAADWPKYSGETFPELTRAWQSRLDAAGEG